MRDFVTIDRATLEQLVMALEKSIGAMQGIYGGWRCEQPLKLANAAITQGRAALVNAKMVELDASTIGELEQMVHVINIVKQKSAVAV